MDRRWWFRGALALILVAFLVILTRTAILAFKPEAARIDRAESAAMKTPPGAAPATAAKAPDSGKPARDDPARGPAPGN